MYIKDFLLKIITGYFGVLILPKLPPTPKGEYFKSIIVTEVLSFRAGAIGSSVLRGNFPLPLKFSYLNHGVMGNYPEITPPKEMQKLEPITPAQ